MDVSNLVCHFHKNKEAMGVCPFCKKKLCLDCYLKHSNNACTLCATTTVKPKDKAPTKKSDEDTVKECRKDIIKIILEIVIGATLGYLFGSLFTPYLRFYFMVIGLSFLPTFHFVHRVDKKLFGVPTHKSLLIFKIVIKLLLSAFLSGTYIGLILSLVEIYLNLSIIVKHDEKKQK